MSAQDMAAGRGGGSVTASIPRSEVRKVVFASSLGTVFEWYDFYLYGSLAAFIGANFFTQYPEATRNIFALLAFAAGFLVAGLALRYDLLGLDFGREEWFTILAFWFFAVGWAAAKSSTAWATRSSSPRL